MSICNTPEANTINPTLNHTPKRTLALWPLFKASIFTVIPAKFLATIPLSAGTYRLCCLAGLEEYVLFDYGVSLVRVWSKGDDARSLGSSCNFFKQKLE